MGSWTTFLITYLFGGVTFIPLVLLVVLAHSHYTLPYRRDLVDDDDIVQPADEMSALDEVRKNMISSDAKTSRPIPDLDVAAGYFAVCREYAPMGLNAKPIERATPVGSTTVAAPSPSVYQTMYRSIFDRKPVPGPLDGTNFNNGVSQRPKKAGNVFYVVLRHGHLMLFDDDEQLEVRHVISLAHHDITIYSGGDVTPEGELFIKRNALCLSRKQSSLEKQGPDSQMSKPFYLFSENCSAKEDFYFALLKSQEQTFGFDTKPPIPKGFEVRNIIALVQRLHSSDDHVHSRWLNALLGRIFLAVYKTRDIENFIREKITKKIARVKRPAFLANIVIQKIDTGEAAPFFTNLKLRDLTVEGECVIEADVRYTGNFRIEVGATAKLDLGTRFKAREVTLLLAVVLKRVEGHVLFKVKAPPSNRLWMSFQTMPKMEMDIEPIVSSRQITYTLILRQIENRIKEVFAETLVQPFWDDLPFFKTEHKIWRGGIFQDDDAVELSEATMTPPTQHLDVNSVEKMERGQEVHNQTRPLEKSHTLPAMEQRPASAGLFRRKSSKGANGNASSILSTSTGVDKKPPASPNQAPRPLNIVKNSTDPIVGTENAHADLFKPSSSPPDHAANLMVSLASRSLESSPMQTPLASPAKAASLSSKVSRRSSIISSKEIEDKAKPSHADLTPIATVRRNTASSAESMPLSESSGPGSPAQSAAAGSLKGHSQTGSIGRNIFARRDTASTTASSESSTAGGSDFKKNTLAAVSSAAEQARQWGWNAIRRQKNQRQSGDKPHPIDLSQPMGRGQPLPPPGTPLPGPTNVSSKLGSSSVATRRKPVRASTPTAEQATPEIRDDVPERRPSEIPRLPQRRRRGASPQKEEDIEQKMLVVAAPDDSQPASPAADSKTRYDEDWGGSTAVKKSVAVSSAEMLPAGEILPVLGSEAPSGARLSASPSPSPPSPPSPSSLLSTRSVQSAIDAQGETVILNDNKAAKEGPLVAVPAAVADVGDDDNISSWMEEDPVL